MPAIKLTEAAIGKLKAPKGGRRDYFDATLPGFGIRVAGPTDSNPEGRKTWFIFYRFAGTQKRQSFDPPYPGLGLAKARKRAGDTLALLSEGKDPAAAKAEQKAAARRGDDTVEAVLAEYLKRALSAKGRAESYVGNTEAMFVNHVLPHWGKRKLRDITRRDIIELLDGIAEKGGWSVDRKGKRHRKPGGPIAANRTYAAIRRLMRWAVKRDILQSMPATMIDMPGQEKSRDRVLSAEEIKGIWQCAEDLGYPFQHFFKILLLTGQRRSEVAGMRWDEIDETKKLWTFEADRTKPGRSQAVPLSPQALNVVEGLKAFRRDGVAHLFTTNGRTAISGYSRAKTRLDKLLAAKGLTDPWTLHDLRRSAATELGRLGISRFIVARILNHSDRSITAVYDRYRYVGEKRHALDTWGRYLETLIKPNTPDSNVVNLRREGGNG